MYKLSTTEHQLTFSDFNQSCGMQLSTTNEWVILANSLNWGLLEADYAAAFDNNTGRVAHSLRMALGSLIIQQKMALSDRNLVKAISENPYFQYFIGLREFSSECPFTYGTVAKFRKRLGSQMIVKFNEEFLKTAESTPEHGKKKKKREKPSETGNMGTLILDATCSPSNIRYPQDFSLLNEARIKTDKMIDELHKQFPNEGRRPRTYKRVLQAAFLVLSKSKKRTAQQTRALIRKELAALKRNIDFIMAYFEKGGTLTDKQLTILDTILKLYQQQKEMFDAKNHRTPNRIVSISQPYIRPIIRGKIKTPVEFGAKYDVSVTEKGHARMEHISFDPYNEGTILIDVIERYKQRTGHYPKRVLVDQVYRTKANRMYCSERHIRMSGRSPGRPSKKMDKQQKKIIRKDDIDRIEVERFFSREKRCFGGGLVMTKLECTSFTSIALSILVANLFGVSLGDFFCFYILEVGKNSFIVGFCDIFID